MRSSVGDAIAPNLERELATGNGKAWQKLRSVVTLLSLRCLMERILVIRSQASVRYLVMCPLYVPDPDRRSLCGAGQCPNWGVSPNALPQPGGALKHSWGENKLEEANPSP
jgi:hypothetical protein